MTVAEIALALMLVAGAGWLVQRFSRLRATDPGFVAAGRLIVDVRPNPASVRGLEQTIAWTRNLFDHLRAIPGVAGVGSTAAFPLCGNLDSSVMVQFQGETFDSARTQGSRMRLVTRRGSIRFSRCAPISGYLQIRTGMYTRVAQRKV